MKAGPEELCRMGMSQVVKSHWRDVFEPAHHRREFVCQRPRLTRFAIEARAHERFASLADAES